VKTKKDSFDIWEHHNPEDHDILKRLGKINKVQAIGDS
jgi:hypothetical protein